MGSAEHGFAGRSCSFACWSNNCMRWWQGIQSEILQVVFSDSNISPFVEIVFVGAVSIQPILLGHFVDSKRFNGSMSGSWQQCWGCPVGFARHQHCDQLLGYEPKLFARPSFSWVKDHGVVATFARDWSFTCLWLEVRWEDALSGRKLFNCFRLDIRPPRDGFCLEALMVKLDVKNDGKEVFTSKRSFSSILVETIYTFPERVEKRLVLVFGKGPAQKRLASQRCVLWRLHQFLG